MDRMHSRWLWAAAASLLAFGCAQSNGDISYVQPNYVKKADLLDGVWYIRNTVTKTPATTGFTYTGSTGDMEKIVWEVQEDHLIGYRAYAQIPGQDQKVDEASKPSGTTATYCRNGKCVGGHKYYGAPVVAYRIQKQFDIQRGYNPATGETTNVISENASDRPWNEREYIRVDWGSNSIDANLETWGMMNLSRGSDFNSYIYANEPNTDPYDWPRQEYVDVNGQQKLSYFEFTARYMAHPSEYYYEGYGNVPLCWLTPGYDCTAQQIEMRTSIAKADPNETLDYEPLVYDNAMMNKFGYFRTERLNYDRRFGINESDTIYLANRHRMWKHYFEKDAQGNVDWNRPVPMAQREVEPIVYYFTPKNRMGGQAEYDKYLEAGRILEKNWDKAFRRAAAAAKGVADWQEVPQILYVCENPVPAGAPAACGPEGFEARFGDVRRSFLWTVPEAVPNGLLGYGPSSADPETGEIISANANIYTAAVATSAQHTLEIINVLTGDLSVDDLIRGTDVKDYMLRNPSYASVQGKVGAIQSELQGDAVQRSNQPTVGEFNKLTINAQSVMQKLKASGGLPVSGGDRLRAAAEILRQHPDLESALLDNPEMVPDMMTSLPAGVAAAVANDPSAQRDVLRKPLLRLPELVDQDKARFAYASNHNIYLAEFQDRYMMGMAFQEAQKRTARVNELVAQGTSPGDARIQADEELRWRLRQSIWRATAEHEIGHTFGLRHNFQGSFDALNYFDPYWDLKKQTLTVMQNNTPVIPRTPADLKAASDGTEEQLYAGMSNYEYSSIMDYGGKSNADWQGVGKYDEAAILFAYSGDTQPGYVEVFDTALRTDTKQFDTSDGNKLPVTGAGYDLPVVNALHTNTAVPNYSERYHYSTLPLHFGTGATLEEVIASGIQNMHQRKLEKWSVVQQKEQQLRDLLRNNPVPAQADVAALQVPAEVPYMFCTDDHEGSVLSCNMWDRGPDYYEMTRTWLEDYWNAYFFNHFRRDRYRFSDASAFNYAYMTFDNAAKVYKHWMYALYGSKGPNGQNVPNFAAGPFGFDPQVQAYWSMATFDGINNLLKVMSVPPAGFYMRYEPTDSPGEKRWDVISEGFEFDTLTPQGKQLMQDYYAQRYGADGFVELRRGEARRMYSRYDYRAGFGFWDRLVEVGHYNDQIGAIFAAVMPTTQFLGVDDYADQNRYYIPYYLMFRDQLNEVFGAQWATGSTGLKSFGENAIRPTLYLSGKNPDGTDKANLVFPIHIKGQDFIQGFDYPRDPVIPDPANSMAAPANVQTTWTSRIYSLYLGMVLFNVNYDLDYAKQNLVMRVGGSEEVSVPTGYETVAVDDFLSGTRYVALQKIGATQETPAVRMIHLAQSWQDIVNDPCQPGMNILTPAECANPDTVAQTKAQYIQSYQDTIRDLDLMRGMYQVYGKAF